jgi:hypothetical protein
LWKWLYYQNQSADSIQFPLKSHQNLIKSPEFILHQNRSINTKIRMKRPRNSCNVILSKKKRCWRYQNTWPQIILQNHSSKNSMVLAQKQTWRPMKQNRRSRNKLTQWQPSYSWQRFQKINIGEKTASSTNSAGKTGYLLIEDWN